MTLFKRLLLSLVLLYSFGASAQQFLYLRDIKLNDSIDYEVYKPDLEKATHYLFQTPINKWNSDRAICLEFIMRFAEGCPQVIIVGPEITALDERNSDLTVMYMGAWALAELNDPTLEDLDIMIRVFERFYPYCKGDFNVKGNKGVRRLVWAGDDGNVAEWVKSYQEPN